MKSSWGLILLIGSSTAVAALPEPVARAFANMRTELACDYTRTARSDDGTRVERYRDQGGGWRLLTVDGEPATRKQLKKYAGQEEQRDKRQRPAAVDFANLGEPDSYALLEEDAGRGVYRFNPLAEDEEDEDIVESLIGKLTIDTQTSRVVSFELTNLEPFSPAAAVTINNMRQTVELEPLTPAGISVTRRIETLTEGRLFGIKKISDHRVITFDDFDCR